MGAGELPEGWAWAELGEIASSVKNGMYVSRPGMEPNGTPILRIGAVRPMRLSLDDLRYTGLGWQEVQEQAGDVMPGDLLFTRYNGNPEYVGAGARVPDGAPELAYPDKLIRVRISPQVMDSRFLVYAWASPRVREQVRGGVKTSAGQAGISGASLKRVRVPVPPLAEQHRIVEALEEQLSRLDAGSVLLEQARLRGSALQKQMTNAVVGGRRRTVEEAGDADEFLSSVDDQVTRVAGKKRWVQVRDPATIWTYELPAGWRWRTLGSLCVDIQYGTSAKTAPKVKDEDVPVIRMGNIQSGRLNLRDLKYLPAEHSDIEKTLLLDGDLLFNRTNSAELVGKSAVYREAMGAAVYASYLIRCRFADGVEPDWVNTVVNSNFGRRYIASVVTQQVGQANVNSAKMALLPIPVPPQAEQRVALKVLRDWEAALGRPQLAARVATKRSEGLRSAILRSAFSGRLTPQDPADEPATALLARIAAERDAAKPARKTKRAASPRKTVATAKVTEAAPAPTPAPVTTVQQELFQ